jgi:hypothetical protein
MVATVAGEHRPFPYLHENLGSLITPTPFLDQTRSQVTKAVAVPGTAGLIKRKREVFHSVILSVAKII